MFDAVKVKNECVQWIKDFFENNGKGCNAVVVFQAVRIALLLLLCALRHWVRTELLVF